MIRPGIDLLLIAGLGIPGLGPLGTSAKAAQRPAAACVGGHQIDDRSYAAVHHYSDYEVTKKKNPSRKNSCINFDLYLIVSNDTIMK